MPLLVNKNQYALGKYKIVADEIGNAYVAVNVQDKNTLEDKALIFKSSDGVNWEDISLPNAPLFYDIAASKDGVLHLVYKQANTGYPLADNYIFYKKRTTAWDNDFQIIAYDSWSVHNSPTEIISPLIELDIYGDPRVIYYNAQYNTKQKIKYTRWTGEQWLTPTVVLDLVATGLTSVGYLKFIVTENNIENIFLTRMSDGENIYVIKKMSDSAWSYPGTPINTKWFTTYETNYPLNYIDIKDRFTIVEDGEDFHLVYGGSDTPGVGVSGQYQKYTDIDGEWTWQTNQTEGIMALRGPDRPVVFGTYSSSGATYLYYKEPIFNPFMNWIDAPKIDISNTVSGERILGIKPCKRIYNNLLSILYQKGVWDSGTSTIAEPSLYIESVFFNEKPDTPTHKNITSNGYTLNKRPKLMFDIVDPDNRVMNIQVQIATENTFATPLQDVQYANDSGYGTQTAGFSGVPTVYKTGEISWTPQSDLPVQTLFIRARVKDAGGLWSDWSTDQQFTIANPPWNNTIDPTWTGFQYQWVNDLATVINNVRAFRGLSSATFTDGTLTNEISIKATHIMERRLKLAEVLTLVGVSALWTDSELSTNIQRKGQHIIELRNYCLQT